MEFFLSKLTKRIQESDSERKNSDEFRSSIQTLQNDVQERIYALNRFGTNTHHVNLPIALNEAELLLQNIGEIVNYQSNAHRAHQCAAESLDYWLSTSSDVTEQLDKTLQLKYDVINVKNRLHDAQQNAHKTFDILAKTNSTHFTNKKRYDNLVHQQKRVSHLHNNIHDIYNTSIIPKTDLVFELIADNHEKIEQDINNVIRLKGIVHESNVHFAESLKDIRDNWLPEAKDYSIDLMVRAEEYTKLFQNTKNGAEVALLARYNHIVSIPI